MKSFNHFQSTSNLLSASEMTKTKGGTSIVISAQLDICLVDHVAGTTSLLFCDRRKRRVGSIG